jgi:hypothetical protein
MVLRLSNPNHNKKMGLVRKYVGTVTIGGIPFCLGLIDIVTLKIRIGAGEVHGKIIVSAAWALAA